MPKLFLRSPKDIVYLPNLSGISVVQYKHNEYHIKCFDLNSQQTIIHTTDNEECAIKKLKEIADELEKEETWTQ
jgi:hypothetical protein